MKDRSLFTRRSISAAAALLLAAFAAGCTSFDYVGRSFAPLPENAPVALFRDRDTMAEGKYAMIGRGVLTAPERYDRYDIEERLRELAREHGADAVLIVKIRKIFRSFNIPEGNSGFAGPSSPGANPTSSAPDGQPLAENSFGQQVEPETYGGATTLRPPKHRYGRSLAEVSVIFYRDAAALRELRQQQQQTIDAAANRSASEYRPLTSPEPAPRHDSAL